MIDWTWVDCDRMPGRALKNEAEARAALTAGELVRVRRVGRTGECWFGPPPTARMYFLGAVASRVSGDTRRLFAGDDVAAAFGRHACDQDVTALAPPAGHVWVMRDGHPFAAVPLGNGVFALAWGPGSAYVGRLSSDGEHETECELTRDGRFVGYDHLRIVSPITLAALARAGCAERGWYGKPAPVRAAADECEDGTRYARECRPGGPRGA